MSSQAQQTATTTPVIDLSGIQAADIIVTRNDSTNSKIIRYGSCSSYSHAILALGNGQCIDAMPEPDGVRKRALHDALNQSNRATLLRHITIDANLGAWVCHYAEKHRGKPYDKLGAARSGVSTGCGGIGKTTKIGRYIILADEIAKKDGHDESFFCSELIVKAFHDSNLSIIKGGAHTATPGAIAKSSYLQFVKELITV